MKTKTGGGEKGPNRRGRIIPAPTETALPREPMAREDKGRGGPEDRSFWDHLEDLRRMLLKCLAALAAASAVAFIFSDRVVELAQRPLAGLRDAAGAGEGVNLVTLGPAEAFLTSLRLALLTGLVVSLPLILFFAAGFILPALTPAEKNKLKRVFLAGGALFYLGSAFAFVVVLPLSLRFFWLYTQRMGVRPEWTLRHYTSLAGGTVLAFGLAFEAPLAVLLLAGMGVIDYRWLKRQRAKAVVAVLVLAALLTPPDAISQLLLAVPLLGLFELSLRIVKLTSGNKDTGAGGNSEG